MQLLKSVAGGGWQLVGELVQPVPMMKPSGTTSFTFSYEFTAEDALAGRVTFQAVAMIIGGPRDASPVDNTVIAPLRSLHAKRSNRSASVAHPSGGGGHRACAGTDGSPIAATYSADELPKLVTLRRQAQRRARLLDGASQLHDNMATGLIVLVLSSTEDQGCRRASRSEA